jgi:hypothetical protein
MQRCRILYHKNNVSEFIFPNIFLLWARNGLWCNIKEFLFQKFHFQHYSIREIQCLLCTESCRQMVSVRRATNNTYQVVFLILLDDVS